MKEKERAEIPLIFEHYNLILYFWKIILKNHYS